MILDCREIVVVVIGASGKALVLAGLAGIVLAAMRVRNGALRHLTWTIVLAAMVLMPVLSLRLPPIRCSGNSRSDSFVCGDASPRCGERDRQLRRQRQATVPLPNAVPFEVGRTAIETLQKRKQRADRGATAGLDGEPGSGGSPRQCRHCVAASECKSDSGVACILRQTPVPSPGGCLCGGHADAAWPIGGRYFRGTSVREARSAAGHWRIHGRGDYGSIPSTACVSSRKSRSAHPLHGRLAQAVHSRPVRLVSVELRTKAFWSCSMSWLTLRAVISRSVWRRRSIAVCTGSTP